MLQLRENADEEQGSREDGICWKRFKEPKGCLSGVGVQEKGPGRTGAPLPT